VQNLVQTSSEEMTWEGAKRQKRKSGDCEDFDDTLTIFFLKLSKWILLRYLEL